MTRPSNKGRRSQTPGARKRQNSAGSNGSGTSSGKCLSWSKTGKCRFGDKCKFTHESAADENVSEVQHSAARSDGNIALPCLSVGVEAHNGTSQCVGWQEHQMACSAVTNGREWVADTGSGNDLLGRNFASNHELSSTCSLSKAKKLRTANGGVNVSSKVMCDIGPLNIQVEPLLLEECPPVLSIGRRVEEGFSFHWTPEECVLICPNGCSTQLEVRGRVPLLPDSESALPADEEVGAKTCATSAPAGSSEATLHQQEHLQADAPPDGSRTDNDGHTDEPEGQGENSEEHMVRIERHSCGRVARLLSLRIASIDFFTILRTRIALAVVTHA
eukprot:4889689-Amphidinium_carterae.3